MIKPPYPSIINVDLGYGGLNIMQINDIKRIMKQEVEKKGYILEERKSTTTNSWYFKICAGKQSLMFRVSDHQTKADLITLRIDKHITEKSVVGFIDNR